MSIKSNPGPLLIGGGLIALYLVVKNPGALSTFLTQGPTGVQGVVKSFQGR